VGESTTKVNLSDVSLSMMNDTLPTLKLKFNRTGNMSVFGDLTVEYISPQGKKTQVGKVSGIAVYTPNLTRRFEFPLEKIKGVDYHSGSLHLVYSSQSDAKPELLSETDIHLQ
jgi:hypothetical protein